MHSSAVHLAAAQKPTIFKPKDFSYHRLRLRLRPTRLRISYVAHACHMAARTGRAPWQSGFGSLWNMTEVLCLLASGSCEATDPGIGYGIIVHGRDIVFGYIIVIAKPEW
jgi:hypothetical protein